ncbi:MAG: four helix bundle protein [Candidatus Nealsonbacteria bacterium]|nr:four helix bundle protein [Candidatus Nealsonbacteria bacterium]
MQDFRKLKVWQKAHELTLAVYEVTRGFPSDERYGLTSQMRRSAASIPANIAEGCGRSTSGDFARFLDIAAGSASEVQYHLLLARDLCHLDAKTCQRLSDDVIEVKRMLASLTNTVRRSHRSSRSQQASSSNHPPQTED